MCNYADLARKSLGEKGNLLTWHFNADELIEDALDKAIFITAKKLCLWDKYPALRCIKLLIILSSAWIELRAFISYERGKLYSDFRAGVLRKLATVNCWWF